MPTIPFEPPVHKEQLVKSMKEYLERHPDVAINAKKVVESVMTFAERMRKKA